MKQYGTALARLVVSFADFIGTLSISGEFVKTTRKFIYLGLDVKKRLPPVFHPELEKCQNGGPNPDNMENAIFLTAVAI